ncbi:hypothetical protein Micbo1qcDRAFT_169458 [Microdochium bolleyi]|uniref:Uncharacterized protein n=1 Tax=Microdochium bolleyi TaxID=196109 RepID=A0A136IK98_9PEZI|nr:hypothetical protein Micbo1qcDRAFT_169458 [Microdochium bolleyi]
MQAMPPKHAGPTNGARLDVFSHDKQEPLYFPRLQIPPLSPFLKVEAGEAYPYLESDYCTNTSDIRTSDGEGLLPKIDEPETFNLQLLANTALRLQAGSGQQTSKCASVSPPEAMASQGDNDRPELESPPGFPEHELRYTCMCADAYYEFEDLLLVLDPYTRHLRYFLRWARSEVSPGAFVGDRTWKNLEWVVLNTCGQRGLEVLRHTSATEDHFTSSDTYTAVAVYPYLETDGRLHLSVEWENTEVKLSFFDKSALKMVERRILNDFGEAIWAAEAQGL